MSLLYRLKSYALWISVSLLLCLLVGVIQMYEREITLDGVRSIDFKLVHHLLDKQSKADKAGVEAIESALNTLTRSNGQVLFPLAVIGKRGCIENGQGPFQRHLCARFPNAEAFEKAIPAAALTAADGVRLMKLGEQYFMFQQLQASDAWLLGMAGQYVYAGKDGLSRLAFFLRYRIDDGLFDTAGLRRMANNSWALWLLIISISLAGGLTLKLKHHAHRRKYLSLKQKQKDIQKSWVASKEQSNALANQLKQKDHLLAVKEIELDDLYEESHSLEQQSKTSQQEQLRLEDEITVIKNSIGELDYELRLSENQVLLLEDREEELQGADDKQQRKLSAQDKNTASVNARRDLERLKKLWRLDQKWSRRQQAEADIAPCDGKTPFTVTQAFIAFENHIEDWVISRNPKRVNEENSFYSNIEYLFKQGLISPDDKDLFHGLRIRRNDWFHQGHQPPAAIVTKLLDYLQGKNLKPLL
ncbi:MAG: hypothetical protein HRU20_27755 [Pseudomonadales bacterium]|nr:hypothetical protein [Pseudomonadales bacterium]